MARRQRETSKEPDDRIAFSEHREDMDGQPPREPDVWIAQGHPWRVDGALRRRWLNPTLVKQHARPIRQFRDSVLHIPAQRPHLLTRELEELARDMFCSMIAAHGIGIAAPQIGIPLRVVLIDVDEIGVLAVNPEAEWFESAEIASEGCLSLRGYLGWVYRPTMARLHAQDIRGKHFVAEGRGYGAQAIAHETDHVNGILYPNRLSESSQLVRTADEGLAEGKPPSLPRIGLPLPRDLRLS